jgi:AcrR family transcriptional regulator
MPPPRSIKKSAPRRAPAAPRRRRSAVDAKRAILDAAEARVASGGPASVRLQDIAADIGVSHPAILHHFGSREDLLRAVMERALAALRADLLATLTATGEAHIDVAEQIEHVFDVLGGHGQARLMAWFALAGEAPPRSRGEEFDFFIRELATLVHRRRVARYAERRRRPPAAEDTLFTILLATLALLGDGLLGESARASSGLDDPAAGRRFRKWFAQLLVAHLDGGGGA